jgi:hypothetical protein
MRLRHVFAAVAAVSSFASMAAAQEPEAAAEAPDATAEAAAEPDAAEAPAPEGEAAEGSVSTADVAMPVSSGKESGFELGARLGWGFPLGDASKDNALSDGISGQIPLQVDLGYRLNPQLFLGGYFMYGIAFVDECPSGADCSASDVRLGAQVTYHFTPITEGNAGWIGGGLGYEWASSSVEAGGGESTVSFDGFEFFNIQGGYDFKVSDQFRVGPYGMFTLAQFSNASVEVPGFGEQEGDIEEKGLHEWLFVGVKGSFGPL